jgi:hypothetical protein
MLKYNKGILTQKVQVSHTKEQFSKSITTGVLQIQLTRKRTFWKAYEILYKSFIIIKALFQSLPGQIKANTESALCKQRATKAESSL